MKVSRLRILLAIAVAAVIGTQIYATGITGSSNRLGGGTDSVPSCTLSKGVINGSGTISSFTARVACSTSGTYRVLATVTSGASSSSGSASASLSSTATDVSITISPAVTIATSGYYVTVKVKK
ncbi:MAG: hypothetical protein FJ039_05910 [Chloroflexi bacterium]|nr:hypothetical protein [Chloroflexota bacterium]